MGPVTSARAEFAWLKGDLEQVMSEARLLLDLAKGFAAIEVRDLP